MLITNRCGIRKGGLIADPPIPQTALVVEAVKKDQEGDAAAALSLYCKALDFFVPALHCEAQIISRTWVQRGQESGQVPQCGRSTWNLVSGDLEGLTVG